MVSVVLCAVKYPYSNYFSQYHLPIFLNNKNLCYEYWGAEAPSSGTGSLVPYLPFPAAVSWGKEDEAVPLMA